MLRNPRAPGHQRRPAPLPGRPQEPTGTTSSSRVGASSSVSSMTHGPSMRRGWSCARGVAARCSCCRRPARSPLRSRGPLLPSSPVRLWRWCAWPAQTSPRAVPPRPGASAFLQAPCVGPASPPRRHRRTPGLSPSCVLARTRSSRPSSRRPSAGSPFSPPVASRLFARFRRGIRRSALLVIDIVRRIGRRAHPLNVSTGS